MKLFPSHLNHHGSWECRFIFSTSILVLYCHYFYGVPTKELLSELHVNRLITHQKLRITAEQMNHLDRDQFAFALRLLSSSGYCYEVETPSQQMRLNKIIKKPTR